MKAIKTKTDKLRLSKQTLRALTSDSLAQVAGGGTRDIPMSMTCHSVCASCSIVATK